MAKMVAFRSKLKLPWLNRTADLVLENLPEEVLKKQLEEYLSFEIQSETIMRKTTKLLMNVWYYEHDGFLLNDAKNLFIQYREDALPIHWGLILSAYPVFADFCRVIGKMTQFQTELTLPQIKRKMADEWGERITLFKSIDEMAATLRSFGVLASDSPGKYHIIQYPIKQGVLDSFLVYAAMSVGTRSSYSFQEINDMDTLFPFEYRMEKETLLQDDRFEVSNLGGELAVSIKVNEAGF